MRAVYINGSRVLPQETADWISNFKKNYEAIMKNGGYPGNTIRPVIGGMPDAPLVKGITYQEFQEKCLTGTGADGIGVEAGKGAEAGVSAGGGSVSGGGSSSGNSLILSVFGKLKNFLLNIHDRINFKSFESENLTSDDFKNPNGGQKVIGAIANIQFDMLNSVIKTTTIGRIGNAVINGISKSKENKAHKKENEDKYSKYYEETSYLNAELPINMFANNKKIKFDISKINKATENFLPKKNSAIESSFIDEVKYSNRGTLAKAFPSYLVCFVDEMPGMIDDKKLFSNYYVYSSVVDLNIHHSDDSPIGTAKIILTNNEDNVTAYKPKETVVDVIRKSNEFNGEYTKLSELCAKYLHAVPFEKITDYMIKRKSDDSKDKRINIQEGARVHIRMGYGSIPSRLPTVFNGSVAEIADGNDVVVAIAQSDGAELVSRPITDEINKTTKDLGLTSEVSNIVASMFAARESNFWYTLSGGHWKNLSRYGIEHFGSTMHFINAFDYRQYDLLQNIYKGSYNGETFSTKALSPLDGEVNMEIFANGQTVWDVTKVCEKAMPDFVAYPRYFGFESRFFYGLPIWNFRDNYYINNNGNLCQTAKAFSQCHIVNSDDDIIDNSIKTSSKGISKNIIGIYTIGKEMASTPLIMSDWSIAWDKQSTKTIDTTTLQNLKFIPSFIEKAIALLGLYDNGKTNAIKVCVSELMNEWKNAYRGELIILGNGSIKPYDHISLLDTHISMNGLFKVKEVIHSMNMTTGFTSTIKPGMIATNTLKNSGMINYYKSLLKIHAMYTQYQSIFNAANDVTKYVETDLCLLKYNKIFKEAGINNNIDTSKEDEILNSIASGNIVYDIDSVLNSTNLELEKIEKSRTALSNFAGEKKKNNKSITEMALRTTSSFGLINEKMLDITSSTFIFNLAFSTIIDAFKYRNTIMLFPMTLNGKVYCSGIRGCKTILPFSVCHSGTGQLIERE